MAARFQSLFPRTAALLESARGEVFPDFAVGLSVAAGVSHRAETHLHFAGCGPDTVFDLASLTKVICTTTLVALAEQKGVFSIERPVRDLIPGFPDARVRFSHLLDHSSGLPAWLPLHSAFHDEKGRGSFDPRKTPALARERYEKEICASWSASGFEKQAVYSDLGFMLLGWGLERAAGEPLDALFQEWVVQPTGLASLQFLPITPDVAPTEDCPWRGHVLRGEAHDDNCYVLGGVAPHAGLFGTARDVVAAGRLWLDAFHGETSPLARETVHRYWSTTHLPSSSRVLGWDGITKGASATGRYFSPASRGHLGFTGTSLWIDPDRRLVVALLTNRVHPTRENERIKQFRPVFHDTLLTELGIAR